MKNHSRAVIKATQMNACMKVTNVQRDIYAMGCKLYSIQLSDLQTYKLVIPLFYKLENMTSLTFQGRLDPKSCIYLSYRLSQQTAKKILYFMSVRISVFTCHTVPWLNSSVTLLVSKAPLKKRLFLSGLDIPF